MKLSRRKRLTVIKRTLRGYRKLGYTDAYATVSTHKSLAGNMFIADIVVSRPCDVDKFLHPFYNGRNITITAPRSIRTRRVFEPKTVSTGLFPATQVEIDHQASAYKHFMSEPSAAGTALQQLDDIAVRDTLVQHSDSMHRAVESLVLGDEEEPQFEGLHAVLNTEHQAEMVDDAAAGRPVAPPTLMLGSETVTSVSTGVGFSKDGLDGMRRDELRALARQFEVANYGSMRKAELIAALKELPK